MRVYIVLFCGYDFGNESGNPIEDCIEEIFTKRTDAVNYARKIASERCLYESDLQIIERELTPPRRDRKLTDKELLKIMTDSELYDSEAEMKKMLKRVKKAWK